MSADGVLQSESGRVALVRAAPSHELRRLPTVVEHCGRRWSITRQCLEAATNKDIAAALHLGERTVARHLSNIFTKIGVASHTAAAAFAYEHDLAKPTTKKE